MARFVIGQPVTTDTPQVLVDAGLKAGRHRFQLVVVDGSGNASKPAEVVVQVGQVVIDPVSPRLPPVTPVRPRRPIR